jgi:hypothetical protein
MVHEITITISVSTDTKGDTIEHILKSLVDIMGDLDIDRDSNYQSTGTIEDNGWERQWEYKITEI